MHFLLILTLITSLISNPIVKDSWHELYKDALELMEEGKYSEAIGKLKEALDSKDEDKHRI
ncbi:MAG: hypothetical protein KDD94_00935, partial [Calditrichaeota bacterium]|nr:hypothetical protein [Calditrichota bacterium]